METNSVFQLLPIEIRQEIFKNLNRASLFKCLFVDRQWCREIVPILWEKPLSVPTQKDGVYYPLASQRKILSVKFTKIINVYVSLFSNEIWQSLHKNKISRPRTARTPTFNYVSYLRHYEPYTVSVAAGVWLKQKLITPTDKQLQKRNVLTEALCNLFLTEAKALKSFYYNLSEDVDIFSLISRGCPPSLIFNNLKELRISEITNEIELQNFFESFTNICHSIRGITLDVDPAVRYSQKIIEISDGDKFKNVMKTQNGLEWLELRFLSLLSVTAIRSIIGGLQYSSRTFRAISFYKINFYTFPMIEGLSSCVNLFCLDFRECNGFDQSWNKTAKHFTKLGFLAIEGPFYEAPISFIEQVIETSGDNLQFLLIQDIHTFPKRQFMITKLLPSILMHCHNLRAISLGKLNSEQLFSIKESCPNLEHIDFYMPKFNETMTSSGPLLPQINSLTIYSDSYYDLYTKLEAMEAICGYIKCISLFVFNDYSSHLESRIESYGINITKKTFHDSKDLSKILSEILNELIP
ncbi:3799_t:CDS:2 [Ambispora leptoticha]|uniref:3799_t:CDS:1 n=1 Tax=Ambispora leptoticha TaxID=144679 RepID=A0A9N9H5P3_9GLOM|nr:3799_t:CDS:2 [Ambispora leptoticha]